MLFRLASLASSNCAVFIRFWMASVLGMAAESCPGSPAPPSGTTVLLGWVAGWGAGAGAGFFGAGLVGGLGLGVAMVGFPASVVAGGVASTGGCVGWVGGFSGSVMVGAWAGGGGVTFAFFLQPDISIMPASNNTGMVRGNLIYIKNGRPRRTCAPSVLRAFRGLRQLLTGSTRMYSRPPYRCLRCVRRRAAAAAEKLCPLHWPTEIPPSRCATA